MATYALADGNNAAISDEDGIHSGGTFTVPAAWNGRKVRMQFQTLSEISGATLYQTLLNGASHDRGCRAICRGRQYHRPHQCRQRARRGVGGGCVHNKRNAWCLGRCHGGRSRSWTADVSGALVNRITSGFAIGITPTAVEWNSEVYDTGGYHDNAVNPSRLTVPPGSSGLVRLSVGLKVDASGGQLYAELRRNGSYVDGLCFRADVQGECPDGGLPAHRGDGR